MLTNEDLHNITVNGCILEHCDLGNYVRMRWNVEKQEFEISLKLSGHETTETAKHWSYARSLFETYARIHFTHPKHMAQYESSQVDRYRDMPNARTDMSTLAEIINRQGVSIVIESIAEWMGKRVLEYGMNAPEVEHEKSKLIDSLRSEICERV